MCPASDGDPLGGHSASLYHPTDGSFLGGTQGEDLWTEITRRPCWIVDNNVPWEAIARAEPEHNFVHGRTMALESDSLRGVVRRLGQAPLPNVFSVEIIELDSRRVIVIDRFGATLRRRFAGLPPTVERRTPEQSEEVNSTLIREQKRMRARQLNARDPAILRDELLAAKAHAVRKYAQAGEISLGAYSIHLRELRRRGDTSRVQRFEENHPNLWGDAEVIQDALFLPAGIISNDRVDVGRMAELLEIPFRSAQ